MKAFTHTDISEGKFCGKEKRPLHLFDTDTKITKADENRFLAEISDNWSVNGNPNGGYLMALIAGALRQQSEYDVVVSLSANFPCRSIPGDAEIRMGKAAGSRQFDHLQARVFQRGREKILATGIVAANLSRGSGQHYESPPPEVASPDSCLPVPALPRYTIFNHIDVLLDPSSSGWLQGGRLSEKSEVKGWARFKRQRPWDALAVLLMTDVFPPPVLASHGMAAWVPTLQMSVTLRNLPASPLLKCRFRTRFITAGILEEDGELWDEDGKLIATSRQVAQFRQ